MSPDPEILNLKPDETRAAAKQFMQVSENISALKAHMGLDSIVELGMKGSSVLAATRQVEQTLGQYLDNHAAWPLRTAKALLDATGKITGKDEENAAGLKLDTSGDPPPRGGKPGGDPKPEDKQPTDKPADPPHDPAPPPPDPAGATGDHPMAIPVGDVQYSGSGTFASGKEATRGYINQALDKLGITDPAARERWTQGYLTMAEHESSYNAPTAQVNNWDRNAQESTYNVADGYGNQCSRGVVQCIPTTFAQYHQPGTSNNIYDPVANICASMNYVMGTYHVSRDASNLNANVGQSNAGTRQGY